MLLDLNSFMKNQFIVKSSDDKSDFSNGQASKPYSKSGMHLVVINCRTTSPDAVRDVPVSVSFCRIFGHSSYLVPVPVPAKLETDNGSAAHFYRQHLAYSLTVCLHEYTLYYTVSHNKHATTFSTITLTISVRLQ